MTQQKVQIPIKLSEEEVKKCKILVCTPMYGGMCFGAYTKSCIDLAKIAQANGIDLRFSFIFNESLITRARNYLADEFLRSDCTHLMFLDADINFNPKDIFTLLALDKEVVGGPYPKKTIAWEKIRTAVDAGFADKNPNDLEKFTGDFVFNPAGDSSQIKVYEPVEVLEIGTGFMLIKREVFEKFQEAYPDQMYFPDHNRTDHFNGSRKICAFFDAVIDPESQRYLSEDYMFCQWARKIGIKIWLCPWMQVGHYGTYLFNGDLKTFALTGDSSHSLDKTRNDRQQQLRDERNTSSEESAPFVVDPSAVPGPPEKPVSPPAKKRGRNSKGKNKRGQ